MPREFSVVALIAAYNEADILPAVTCALIDEGIGVYLLDHGSTDGTPQALEPWLGTGLLTIEPFPTDRYREARNTYSWTAILERKRELSMELDADWFIHHDADEFREGIWDGLSLRDAIQRVDGLGYNAIDFEVFNFWPTNEDMFVPGSDPRPTLRRYGPNDAWNKLQVKCWKKTPAPPDLVSSGGHDVMFPGRHIFPLRFLLRHYPLRSRTHGQRKVFEERRPRFVAEERAKGWHVQYDAFQQDESFVRDPDTLTEYDPVTARLHTLCHHRGVDDLIAERDQLTRRLALREDSLRAAHGEIERQMEKAAAIAGRLDELAPRLKSAEAHIEQLEAALAQTRLALEAKDADLARAGAEHQRLRAQEAVSQAELAATQREIHRLEDEIRAVYASKSWRWMAPLRAVYASITGRSDAPNP